MKPMRCVASALLLSLTAGCGGGGVMQPAAPVDGTYSGAFMIFGQPVTVTATLKQGANTSGSTFALSGSAHATDNICGIPLAATALTGTVTGTSVTFNVTNAQGGTPGFTGTAPDNTFKVLNGTIGLSGSCSGVVLPLDLSRQ